MQLHIGIDDTDSRKGGCTTYIAARLVEKFYKMGVRFTDYPNIIRLNPNIPYKTRGNAAVALRFELEDEAYDQIVETALDEIEKNSHLGQRGTEPAIVILKGRPSVEVRRFSLRALRDVIPDWVARKLIVGSKACGVAYGGTLGFVGALAAVGQTLEGDHTYELVAYREPQNCGTSRRVDDESVRRMDRLTSPLTFNNYDYDHQRILVTPHGPDPVLLGVRGETAEIVLESFRMLTIREPIERWVIFRTNHGTDAHLQRGRRHSAITLNSPITLKGTVLDMPRTIRGGHTFFTLSSTQGSILCAAFEPTGKLRDAARRLRPGDRVTVFGGVHEHSAKMGFAINLEKILVQRVAREFRRENPSCPNCGKHMKSAGRSQGFRCVRCSVKAPFARKCTLVVTRSLRPGLYTPSMKAHRHLTKPLSRYGLERTWKKGAPSGAWHRP